MQKSRLGRLLVGLAACVGLNLLLTLQNAWPSLWVRPSAGLSVELLTGLALIAVYLERRPEFGRWFGWFVASVLFLLIVGRYCAVTAHALFGRSINLYFDLPHLPDVVTMTADSRPVAEVVFFAAAAVIVPILLLLLIRLGVGAIAESLSDRPVRRVVLGIAVVGCGAYTASAIAGFRWSERAFAQPVSPVYARQVGFVADAFSGRIGDEPVAAPVAPIDAGKLDGKDVFVLFLESYGEVAYSVPEIAAAVRPRMAQAEGRLRAKGWHMASGYFTSPTFGGASWLAHSSFLTGAAVSQNRDYQLLLSSARPSLVGEFAQSGYRTVALMPGLKLAWPEGDFYGFDKIYDASALDYHGHPFGWWSIPDQFTLGRLLEKEVGVPDRKPLFVVFPTVMSHMPFAPVPPYLQEWGRAAEAGAYGDTPTQQKAGAIGDWNAVRGSYRAAMLYNLQMVEGFLADRAPSDALIVVLGDHQPPGVVSGPDASWLVPVHVFSRDAKQIDRFRTMGFRVGLTPKGATLGDFAALHRKFAEGL